MSYLAEHVTAMDARPLVAKVWGWEEVVHNDHHYCGKILHYNGRYQSSLHMHLVKDEVLMVVKGVVQLEIVLPDGTKETAVLSELRRDAVHLEPGVLHRLKPFGEAQVYEWSTSHNDEDVVRIEESCQI